MLLIVSSGLAQTAPLAGAGIAEYGATITPLAPQGARFQPLDHTLDFVRTIEEASGCRR
jgi:hypothetical protein